MILICPVRPGDTNEELRYALRSWETNLVLPSLELMTVGHCPAWLDPDVHVPGNHFKSAPLAVFDNVRLGAEVAADMGAREVLYMNDDFFCLDPVAAVPPVKRNISLAKHIAGMGAPNTWWGRSLRLTASWLTEQGYPTPDSYEVHRPLPAAPHAMLSALDAWGPADKGDMVPQWRTAYGVLNQIEAYPVGDAKLGLRQTGVGTPWVSTSDQTWRRYALPIKKRFQKPSVWERA